jgi:hypothetical protein
LAPVAPIAPSSFVASMLPITFDELARPFHPRCSRHRGQPLREPPREWSPPCKFLQRVAAPTSGRDNELSPAQVNEISHVRGLAICWQPGNVYRIGRTAAAKSCLVQFDGQGRELARYGSWRRGYPHRMNFNLRRKNVAAFQCSFSEELETGCGNRWQNFSGRRHLTLKSLF